LTTGDVFKVKGLFNDLASKIQGLLDSLQRREKKLSLLLNEIMLNQVQKTQKTQRVI